MYCIKCGVKLSDGQERCPLCSTRVYHPDIPFGESKPTYPKKDFESEELNLKGLLFVITILWVLPLVLPVVFELL
jgi:NAD-dependent SIR2 family protein deacetylase